MRVRWISVLAQGLGFVAGAVAGFALARVLGIDLLHELSGPRGVLGVGAVGLGGGVGIGAARRWCERRGINTDSKE